MSEDGKLSVLFGKMAAVEGAGECERLLVLDKARSTWARA
jgi:hypothetical protein